MTLFLNNDDVKAVLTMDMAIDALEEAYLDLAGGEAVCRPRIDIRVPSGKTGHTFVWGSMEGGSNNSGYFAVRMKSDIIYHQEYAGVRTQEKYCYQPGLFCGLIFLVSVRNAEPLALINDGYLQHMRVGADSAIGVKYMARDDAHVVGMLGSGGMARSHAESFSKVRDIRRIQVFSPTPEHRQEYAREIAERLGIEVVCYDNPRDIFKGADIVAGCTDSVLPLEMSPWLEDGTHIISVGGRPDEGTLDRIDVSLRLGSAPGPIDLAEWKTARESVTYAARGEEEPQKAPAMSQLRWADRLLETGRLVYMEDLLAGRAKGRTSPSQITWSERGNIQGAQFYAVAGKVYELARERGLGRELPTEWFLQDIVD